MDLRMRTNSRHWTLRVYEYRSNHDLGRGLISAEPYADGCELDEGE
jgi:hypothetical protein